MGIKILTFTYFNSRLWWIFYVFSYVKYAKGFHQLYVYLSSIFLENVRNEECHITICTIKIWKQLNNKVTVLVILSFCNMYSNTVRGLPYITSELRLKLHVVPNIECSQANATTHFVYTWVFYIMALHLCMQVNVQWFPVTAYPHASSKQGI